MANLMSFLKPVGKPQRNGFDLSNTQKYTLKAGLLTPVECIEVVPGDHVELSISSFLRTRVLETAAFMRGKQNFNVFFVPYQCLWHDWNNFINQRLDKTRATQKDNLPLFAPCFEMKEFLYSLSKGAITDIKDVHGYHIKYNVCRLLDMLGYGNFTPYLNYATNLKTTVQNSFNGVRFNAFRLLAYQKIWQDYFRDRNRDISDTDSSYTGALSFNVDDLDCTTIAGATFNTARSSSFGRRYLPFVPRYVKYKTDLFTGSQTQTQYGSVSLLSLGSSTPMLDALSLKRLESLQEWKQKTMLAGNKSKDLQRAHFGLAPAFDDDDHAQFIGSFDSPIMVDDVTSTDSSNLGELGGKGSSGTPNNHFSFDAKDYGIIMVTHHVLPESEYPSYCIDALNTFSEPFDFYTPEFQNLGLESVLSSNICLIQPANLSASDGSWSIGNSHNPSAGTKTVIYKQGDSVIGYAPRYWPYKTKLDMVHGDFNPDVYGFSATYNNWVAPRLKAITSMGKVLVSDLYVNPNIFDSIFGVSINSECYTDQFLINSYFDVKKVSPMSVLGLPQF